MSADVRTRRLIVALPDVSGEEADEVATAIEAARFGGGIQGINATVTHALDDAPLDAPLGVWPQDVVEHDEDNPTVTLGQRREREDGHDANVIAYFSPDDARKLAALLLRAADESEGSR